MENTMNNRTWDKKSFWESYDQNRITTILTIVDENENSTTQQLTVNKFDVDGNENPDFKEVLDAITFEAITANTNERNEKKLVQRTEAEQARLERARAKDLQQLFEAKISAFEIDAIKNSTNRVLKSKLRKAQNVVEVNVYCMMIVMEVLNNENGTD
tara:strand:- start:985 stop:1455 length:471 start_codon:yes stop_codon:yes gene_type:complete